ncbi:Leucine-rich repeat transmembrane protein kinase [Rhynchospora pubera]|uniref:Leucine-rich repeat transmembrane protein kinase n=1 Tax=Rhynchospora pubera TaxID=906938 RepID=A0AAV8D6S8_9POAL|nr:Leucine-rich repeat transmembrane protein kinase [Rhynchospora pubera]KAJ4763510.1 Leucine-rich repeat transmembrane protein kinase [Rhynchospora pubera]KAJ4792177.1 Leucine-rich repeat transmembrane protein kinase [Rhynchospora pubera]
MKCLCGLFGKNSALETVRQNEDIPGVNRIKIFSYNELRKATDGFSISNKIGEGGFGSVYKGKLKDGTIVAVKVLSSESRQGVREFLTELTVISDIEHENLVRLHGCCVEGINRILVYPYMENNSLAQTLLGRNPDNLEFNWQTRVKLCIGVARGLAFLHDEIRPPIIHRDIKASNILLDKNLTPKISDFGLAKLLPPNTTHVSTRVAGTIGYLAPEYAIRGQVTRKSDIYSFGVLLLEIVSGRCNTNTRLPYEDQFLLERTWALYEQENLEKIIDAFLGDDLDVEEATRFLKVALLCTQDATRLRPSMSTVLKLLTGKKSMGTEKITKPAVISDFMDLKVKSTKENSNFGQISTTICSSAMASTAFSSEDDTTLLSTTFSDKD